ncbi:hypothetical protein JMJ77_0001019 [Colletotrichum scovillei]|uniref:Uncharacterized protein n=1 Tax=Colletotrichum scovillei TaxID=1209932 RepID=A0A9P7RAR2_9PEZI|nr:hypothetical protein JMJ77_0001019 [Colletotrichum scovillei]KAG7072239.1 hypothetical protein JMJ76_0005095 [Colletotrichum scovillei]KAG7080352.1 hypothetical protein JMJ78_0007448 [Colletotrichum scovillei]
MRRLAPKSAAIWPALFQECSSEWTCLGPYSRWSSSP